jgi:hypothetical protein
MKFRTLLFLATAASCAAQLTVTKTPSPAFAVVNVNSIASVATSDLTLTGSGAIPASLGDNGIAMSQPAEGTALPFARLNSFTSGSAPFQEIQQSFANSGGGAGTYNHGVFIGWNAGRHAGDFGIQPGVPAILTGYEDNFYDTGSSSYGTEWYVENWSGDGSLVIRPFYSRMRTGGNSAEIVHNIGEDANGLFQVNYTNSGTPAPALIVSKAGGTISYGDVTVESSNVIIHGTQSGLTLDTTSFAPFVRFGFSGVTTWIWQALSTTNLILGDGTNSQLSFTAGSTSTAVMAVRGQITTTGNITNSATTSTAGLVATATALSGSHTMAVTETTTVYTGTGGHTFTFLAASTNSGRIWIVKNRGSAALTCDATGLGQFFTTTAVNTVTLNVGDAIMFQSDGTTWNVQ